MKCIEARKVAPSKEMRCGEEEPDENRRCKMAQALNSNTALAAKTMPLLDGEA